MANVNQKAGGTDLIRNFLRTLNQGAELITAAYAGNLEEIPEEQENIFARLRGQRVLMQAGGRYRLNPNLTSMLNYLLSHNSSRHIEIDLISRLRTLDRIVEEYLEHRQSGEFALAEETLPDIEQMTFDITFTAQDAVYGLANRIQTQFGFVRSIRDKISENEAAISTATKLVDNFTAFTFTHMMDLVRQDTPDSPLYGILCSGLLNELAKCQSDLNVILIQLREMLATFRSEVHKTNILKAFHEHYANNPDYRPRNYADCEMPHELFCRASALPFETKTHADMLPESEKYNDTLADIVKNLSRNEAENLENPKTLASSDGLDQAPEIKSETIVLDDITEDLTTLFRQCIKSAEPVSATEFLREQGLGHAHSHWLFAVGAFYEDMPPENRKYFECRFIGHGQYHEILGESGEYQIGNRILEDIVISTRGL
ncbi:MAG: hypothetical protein J6P70_02755 [Ruminobacter sp.]|nr:hypothetical protein [Ruminobacter sp.]